MVKICTRYKRQRINHIFKNVFSIIKENENTELRYDINNFTHRHILYFFIKYLIK